MGRHSRRNMTYRCHDDRHGAAQHPVTPPLQAAVVRPSNLPSRLVHMAELAIPGGDRASRFLLFMVMRFSVFIIGIRYSSTFRPASGVHGRSARGGAGFPDRKSYWRRGSSLSLPPPTKRLNLAGASSVLTACSWGALLPAWSRRYRSVMLPYLFRGRGECVGWSRLCCTARERLIC